MRIDAKALGVGAVLIIIGILIGFFARQEPPPDGNPVGFHLKGYAKMDQPALNLSSCSNTTACYLRLDMTFNPSVAPSVTPVPCATPPNGCFSFSNVTTTMQPIQVTIDYEGYSGKYTEDTYGVIQGSPSAPPSAAASPNPTPRH